MNKDGFSQYLKRKGKKEHVVSGLVKMVEKVELMMGKEAEVFTPVDLEACLAQSEKQKKGSGRKVARALALYYKMLDVDALYRMASNFRETAIAEGRSSLALKEFMGIKPEVIERLRAEGISNARQLLEHSRRYADRYALAKKTGIPYPALLECVKLADLSRIPGVKQVRARLYLDMGLDTVEKMAIQDPQELVNMARAHVEQTGFNGIPTLPAEARSTVKTARELPPIVEYEAGE